MLQQIILWLFQLLFLTVPLFFTWVNDELFEFNKMVLTYVLTICIVTAWLIRMVQEKRVIFKRTPFDIPIVLFLLSQVASTVLSIHPQTSWFGYYSRFHGGLLSTITYTLLYYAFVSNIEKKHLVAVYISLFTSALITSFYGIFEHFGHSPSCLLISGNFDASCWIQDVKNRVFSTFGQPNWQAAYAITILPLSLVLASLAKHRWLKLFYIVSFVALYTVLLFTKSRSGILGFGVSAFMLASGYAWLRFKGTGKTFNKNTLSVLGGTAAAVVLLSLIFGTPYTPSAQQLLQPQKEIVVQSSDNAAVNRLELGGTDSGEIRKIVWTGAIDVWKRYPLFGSGVETFAYSYYLDRPQSHNLVSEWDFLYNKAHNEYLNFLATTGIFGLTTYILFQAWFSLFCLKIFFDKSTADDSKQFSLALLSGYAALSVSNFFGFSTVMVGILFYLFPAFLLLYTQDTSKAATKKISAKHSEDSFSYIGSSIVAVIGLICIAAVVKYWNADKLFTQSKTHFSVAQYSEGLKALESAIDKNPGEALYYDTLADTYAQIAAQLAAINETTAAGQFSQNAIGFSDKTIELNPAHLNYYKTRIRIFLSLASIDPKYLEDAKNTTVLALEYAPTDAKLQFTLAQILMSQGKTAEAVSALEKTVEMKPNYEAAYQVLAQAYLENGNPTKARETANFILTQINPTNPVAQEIATNSAEKVTE